MAGDVDREDDVTSELSQPFSWPVDGDSGSGSLVDPEMDNTLELGTLLNDRFEIVRLVHTGGMGHVYKAIDRRRHPAGSGQIHVAIKMLRESLSDREEFRMMLEREAAKAQSLSHSNIVNIFDFDEFEGQFFLVMEWLEGESVRTLLQRTSGQRLAPTFAWTVIEGTAKALHHAHINNVIHADINPSNIFITATLDIKLLDFGVARYADDSHNLAESEATWVTPAYASPELLAGLRPVFQDDVFSLGCVAYQLLGGAHPFEGIPSSEAKQRGIAVEPIPGVPESEWQILSRALAYSRSERPDTVEAFLQGHYRDMAIGVGAHEPKWKPPVLHWGLPVAAAVFAAIGVGWWLRPDVPATDPVSADIPTVSPAEQLIETDAPFIEALLVAAKQAADNGRLILPENDNARDWYREVLIDEPENREALRGLRSISDTFAEQAVTALKSGDPQTAATALTIASETDSANPAIPMVSDLLTAQGDAQLAVARMAAAAGDFDRAASALAQAESYAHIDPSAINEVREQLAGLAVEIALRDGLAVVDSHVAADRLLNPAGTNARESLAALSDEYGDDPRLTAAYERLAERLLTRAALAITAGEIADAEVLIEAAASLGVLEVEVDLLRESLARTAVSADSVQEAVVVDEVSDTSSVIATDSGTGADPDDALDALLSPLPEQLTEAGEAGAVPPGSELVSAGFDPAAGASRVPAATSLDDLGLEQFIAPRYPRTARRRGLSGYVEVAFDINQEGRTDAIEVLGGANFEIFGESATDAVRKWRFAPRQDTIRESVVLRFEIAE